MLARAFLFIVVVLVASAGGCPPTVGERAENGNSSGVDSDLNDNGGTGGQDDEGDGGSGGGGDDGGGGAGENQRPIIDAFSVTPAELDVGQSITIAWQASDPDGDALSAAISVDEEQRSDYLIADAQATHSQSHVYLNAGLRNVRLRVSDGKAERSFAQLVVVRGPIEIVVQRPYGGHLVGDDLLIQASANAAYDIAEVTAQVGDRSTTLAYTTDGVPNAGRYSSPYVGFEGHLDLTGLPRGYDLVRIRFRDLLGNVAEHPRGFMRDLRPQLTVLSPEPQQVATPWIRLRGWCVDDDPSGCDVEIRAVANDGSASLARLARGESDGAFEIDAELSAYNGRSLALRFTATDSAQQSASVDIPVFVFVADGVANVAEGPASILDVGADRLLCGTPSVSDPWLCTGLLIVRRSDGARQDIPIPDGWRAVADASFLTPTGAIFVTYQSGQVGRLYDWNLDRLLAAELDVHGGNGPRGLDVSGDYAAWYTEEYGHYQSWTGWLLRRRFSTEFTELVSGDVGPSPVDVTSAGFAAFTQSVHLSANREVATYDGSTVRVLTAEPDVSCFDPRSDGSLTAYVKHRPASGDAYAIALHDGVSERVLREYSARVPVRDADYRVAGGWVAFTRLGNLHQTHVWRRAPDGAEQQMTFFGDDTAIDGLAPSGEMVITHAGRRFAVAADGSLRDVGAAMGEAFWIDGWWEIAVGRALFRVGF